MYCTPQRLTANFVAKGKDGSQALSETTAEGAAAAAAGEESLVGLGFSILTWPPVPYRPSP